jgi:hypothetical protein
MKKEAPHKTQRGMFQKTPDEKRGTPQNAKGLILKELR